MKRFSILLTLLLSVISAYADFTKVPISVDGSTEIPGYYTLFADDNLSVNTVYPTTSGNRSYTYEDDEGSVSFSEWIQLRVSALPSSDAPYGAEQSGSTPVVITVSQPMVLKSYVRTGSTKTIELYDENYTAIQSYVTSSQDQNSDTNSFFVTSWSITPGTYVLLEMGGTGRLSGLAYEIIDDSQTLRAPILSQKSCEFYKEFELTIYDMNDPSATIYYTMDGSVPSAENGIVYTSPITIPAEDATIKAISVRGDKASGVVSATYRFFAKHLLSIKIPNKNSLKNLYYSSGNEYGELYDDGAAYIADGGSLDIGFNLNSGYRCEDILIDGASQTISDNLLNFVMPSSDVEVVINAKFDPSSPSDPSAPENLRKYTLLLASNPIGAGSFDGNGEYTAGSVVNVYVSPKSGYVFTGWTNDGETVSTNASYQFTMPSSDVVLTATFAYNPSSPADPDQAALNHPLTVIASPAGAGTFSTSGTEVTFGKEYYVYAYPQNGYKFKGWIVNGVAQEGTSTQYRGVMTDAGAQVVGLFTFDPNLPSNPGANFYDSSSGQAIIDDFSQGRLYDAINDAVGYDNFGNVSSIIVKGRMSSDDFGTLSYLTNAAVIDLSRVGEVSSIPGYAFQNMSAESISLPSTISELGNYVFRNCGNLSSLTIYAQEPPVCNTFTFSEFLNKDNCTIFVPGSAIELYDNSDYWKDFTILPITSDAHVLQVNLPEDASDGRYKNNSIEIVNSSSGVRQKYVISDRLLYTFNGLQKDEQYNIYMYSQAGLEIGRIENVVIPDEDIEVTFDNLKKLYTVFAKVTMPDGNDVTSDVSVEWLKPLADGTVTYLRKSASLGEIPEGQALICRVTLNNQLGTIYAMPEDCEFTVGDEQNTCIINLKPFRNIVVSGTVVDGDGSALYGASVSVNQTLNGKYSKTYTAKTDRQGKWSLSVFDAPETQLTFAATECVNVNDTIGAFEPEIATLDLGKTTLKSIVGTRVSYGFTYQDAGADEVQDYYSDYQNVLVSVFNATQNRAHNDISLQYPILAVLDESINAGDELKLTATSKTGAFNPIVKTVAVDENQRAEVTFDIIGKGGISASFEMTDNPTVVAMLYSSKGEFLKKQNYSEANAMFTTLEDGEYTVVTMGQSNLMNSILRLSNFDEVGLTEGKDYVKNTVKVESGKLSQITNSEIPAFDESLFYYTNSSASFTSNKSSITTGNYLTLRSTIDFKDVYKNDITNVSLIVDLPEACEFVEQSVIQGPNLLPYTIDNNRLTVQLGNAYTAQTRFCVVPTTGGSFNATASIVFDYKGKPIRQPIGSAISSIKDLEIHVPVIIADNNFKVTGTSVSQSSIEIIEDNEIIGKGKSNRSGYFNIGCSLNNPYNLSSHEVYARITTPSGNVLKSESKNFTYNPNAVKVHRVIMTEGDNRVVFDFENPDNEDKYYYYSFGKFTFLIEFNSPKAVHNAILYVHTTSGDVARYPATYDASKDVWFVTAEFSTDSLPLNVSIDFDSDNKYIADSNVAKDILSDFMSFQVDLDLMKRKSDEYLSELKNNPDLDFLEFIGEADDNQEIDDILTSMTEDELSDFIESFIANGDLKLESDEEFDLYYSSVSSLFTFEFGTVNLDNDIIVKTSKYSQIKNEIDLSEFYSLDDNNGNKTFYYQDEAKSIYIDESNDLYIEMDITSSRGIRKVNAIWEAGNLILDAGNRVLSAYNDLQKKIVSLTAHIEAEFISRTNQSKDLTVGCKAIRHRIAAYQIKIDNGTADPWDINDYDRLKSDLKVKQKNLNTVNRQLKLTEKLRGTVKWLGPRLNKICPVIKYINLISSGSAKVYDFVNLYNGLPEECPADPQGLINCQTLVNDNGWFVAKLLAGNLTVNVIADIVCATQIIGGAATAGVSLVSGFVTALLKMAGSAIIDFALEKTCSNRYNEAYSIVQALTCEKDCGTPNNPCPKYPNNNGNSGKTGHGGKGGDHQSGNSDSKYGIDPSGYVYEAVPENRVEGVQATIYYKETKEDMYGDPYEEIVLWDAEEYAQENPLFTDANGMYQWDVPQGLWQVKFEKDGYTTAYSEWLPVPPPQLEVNIGIVQNKQPEVTEARAYEEGVEVQFDKFMDLSKLTTDNIYVTANGEKLNGSIHLVDSALADEYADEEDKNATRYASRVRFIPDEPLSVTTGEIRVTVSRNVLSYAGIPMTETFSQVLDVEKEVQVIAAEDVKVLYGGEKEITVFALPYEAAVGRTLRVSCSSDLIATVDRTETIINEEGKATIVVKGDLPGRAQLSFIIDDVTVTGECAVDVVTEIVSAETPRSTRASGTAVYRGTKIELITDSKDGVIYFTTDGSCPCDENGTRSKYTEPIVVNDDVTILAVTTVGNDELSDIVEFNYTLKRSDIDFTMDEGWTWISHNFESSIAVETVTASNNVQRIMSQTQEVVRDPKLGIVGSLKTLNAAESYKVETSSSVSLQRMSDVAWNPATPIALNSGWNWLGYPVGQTMSVDEAFAPTEVENLDVIVGQNGFAQFDGENWVGTLETLTPGLGYMYQSQSPKNVIYNTAIVSKAAARNNKGISSKSPLAVDIHKYPSVMPVIATIKNDNGSLDNEDYQVNAFCGSECRGIGRVVNGLVMINVYGNLDDEITFQITDFDNSVEYTNDVSLRFSETVVGDIYNPYAITIGGVSGISGVSYEGNIMVSVVGDMLIIKGIDPNDIDLVEVYDIEGHKLIHETKVSESGIRISHLSPDVYVVIVNGNGEYTYHKIALR